MPAQPRSGSAQPSGRKLAALRELEKLGLQISDGSEYLPRSATAREWTLTQIRQALACIKEPLAQTVIEERRRS